LETEAVIINQLVVGQFQITAEQYGVRPGSDLQISFDNDDDIQGLAKLDVLLNSGP
jgi:hypothetical protein